jgi:hypothetical protein
MSEVIGARADVTRIEDHIRRALRAALARGGEIADAANGRLGPAVAGIDSAIALRTSTDNAEATAWAAVLAEDGKSDTAIGAIRDAMWNALGRPRQSPYLDQVFPGGVMTYTAGDPRSQPVLMQILSSRILATSAPQWPQATCAGWAAQIDSLRASYATAVEAHRPTEAAAAVADAAYRSAVRAAHARLQAFKRDLLNLGLTQAQIQDIIPDASAGSSGSAARPPAGGQPVAPGAPVSTGTSAGGNAT